jgi:ATP-dependent Clp protease ATP-binding subunit ClpA
MFERFTEPAREMVVRANTEARELHHPVIGTEHLLLALLHEDAGLAYAVLHEAGVGAEPVRAEVRRLVPGPVLGPEDAAALRVIGIDLGEVLARIEESFGPDALDLDVAQPAPRGRGLFGRRRRRSVGRFAPRSKKVLELALREALRLRHNYIGTEHILLGLIREGEGLAAKILTEAGVSLPGLRQAIEARLGETAQPPAA